MQQRRTRDQPGRPDAYFRLGFENYVAGRHAMHCGYVQVAAHLFHHAAELILKSELLTPAYNQASACLERERDSIEAGLDPEAVRQNPDLLNIPADRAEECLQPYVDRAEQLKLKFGHRLPRLWREFITDQPDLGRFTSLIHRLHAWEDIRYPAFPGGRGNAITLTRRGPSGRTWSREPVNRYDLNLDHVDELVGALIVAMRVNSAIIPTYADRSPGGPGLEDYLRDNHYALGTPQSSADTQEDG